jgi:succinate dehydrogenase / fumarate reductase flavoprotein subunit
MQGLGDGYFVLPLTVGDYIAQGGIKKFDTNHAAFKDAEREATAKLDKLLTVKGKRSADSFWKELGTILWDNCGMARSKESLELALTKIPPLREEYWKNVKVLGASNDLNQELEKANRVADYLEFAELLCTDALHRNESCGGHFRVEFQTPDGEAVRNDAEFAYVAAWGWKGEKQKPELQKEPLVYENIQLATRSYK